MSDSFRTPTSGQNWSSGTGNGYQGAFANESSKHDEQSSEMDGAEIGRALLVGLLGGLLSAAGYMIYRRLPEEQKEKLHEQARSAVQQRINEIRQNFNI
ncbi:MAG: hypothetical protein JO199_05220 [Candidatus Eremiobacteraeota bacterium]|nr:hypothetical protein [Candidatus Eremiobacteraeota bacterium]